MNFNPALEVLLKKECHFHSFWDVHRGELIVLDGAAFEYTHVRITSAHAISKLGPFADTQLGFPYFVRVRVSIRCSEHN